VLAGWEAAPAGWACNPALGRLRGPARRPLRAGCEELAGRAGVHAGPNKRGPELSQGREPLVRAAMERWEAQHPSHGCARSRKARGGADRKAPPKEVSQTSWRLPALHSLAGRKKGKRRTRRRSNNTGGEACALATDVPRGNRIQGANRFWRYLHVPYPLFGGLPSAVTPSARLICELPL
jgi:hypothetical protein